MVRENSSDKYTKIVELARRRGFFWPSYEIYGGVAGFYDLGPLGAALKNNIIQLWREYFIVRHSDIVVEIETPVITPKVVFEASGHLQHFTDPIVECLRCGRKFRADQLIEEVVGIKAEGKPVSELTEIIRSKGIKCPVCGGDLSDVKLFNLLFQTFIGPYTQNVAFLRPETAQGMFVNFKRVHTVMREKLPLGIAQIGRVARNEISPRQGMFRLREFTIAEMEFFYDPEEPGEPPYERFDSRLRILTAEAKVKGDDAIDIKAEEAVEEGIIKSPWLAYWMVVSKEFVKALGVSYSEMMFEEKLPHERAHYATQTFDQLVKVSRWGWIEVSGHAYRGDYDLSGHIKYSGQDLSVFKRFKEPKVIRRKVVKVNKAVIGKMFKSEAPNVLRVISETPPEVIEELISNSQSNYLVLRNYRVPKEALSVETIEEKISGKKFVPHVAEPSFGVERLILVALEKAYHEEEGRVVLKLPVRLAPIKVAVLPLLTKEPLVSVAKEVYEEVLSSSIPAIYDEAGSIGRRYARADEVGVPYAVTIDYQTLEDGTVTIRFRDSRRQVRVHRKELISKLRELMGRSEVK